MRSRRSPAARRELKRLVRQIVETFHPQKVILFGSRAYGAPTRDSDVDLLVIMHTRRRPLHVAAEISAAIDHPFPIDILVLRPADWDQYLAEGACFAVQVAEHGLTMYEADNARLGPKG